jgi:hypothetical protein
VRILLLLAVGCTQQTNDRPSATTEPVVIAPAPAAAPRVKSAPGAPEGKVLALKELQRSLGSEVATCTGTAQLIASQGTTSAEKRAWRERTVARLCNDDRWPAAVRSCVANADHDQLSCTSHLETKRQRDHWNAALESWFDPEPPSQ